ncbi:hypothetical protein [Leadbettera azotonutricia]|uniref:Uncharacterized protein n=1 Tax=Leadbettera azotonutricia (strain ATCC BAA-888 / DSM 13862 / ZAS-9) TaxID=545695 RepID=F5YA90_LEAAZ|nr:hypothetical protein [Leadbettera azotonutricia]AEF80371.1 hypothetical protein TREAZ_0741 [Leadbettera azotonutricia ZAS-9]
MYALRRDISRLDEKPEQPVYMGGTFRGTDFSIEGIMFSGVDVYVKTVSISH